jgi:hypothetical protein
LTGFSLFSQESYVATTILDVWEKNSTITYDEFHKALVLKGWPLPAASAAPGNLFKMQVLRPQPSQFWGLSSVFCFNQPSRFF